MPEGNVIDFEGEKVRLGDHLVRGTAADGFIRAVAVTARGVVQTAHENHGTSAVASAALGRLMMGALMMASIFKSEDELLTLQVKGDGPLGGLTVTANNRGQVKGFANHPHVWVAPRAEGKLDVGAAVGKGTLSVVRDLPGMEPYTSQTELVSGEIGDDLAAYFLLSDQIPTSVGVGVLVNGDTSIRQAGGFIIQLMPGYDDELVDELEPTCSSRAWIPRASCARSSRTSISRSSRSRRWSSTAAATTSGLRAPCSRSAARRSRT